MSKTFSIGGRIAVNRLGFGAMQITGPGVWGPPRDRAEALRVLRRLPELGVNFIDTADSYGPDISEQLIREALLALIQRESALRLAALGGSDPDLQPIPRRQSKPA